jgi:hypothetical protein
VSQVKALSVARCIRYIHHTGIELISNAIAQVSGPKSFRVISQLNTSREEKIKKVLGTCFDVYQRKRINELKPIAHEHLPIYRMKRSPCELEGHTRWRKHYALKSTLK